MAEVKREKFLSRRHLIFAAIGSAIGLGNVWRFPYMTYAYGGAAFLIPYIIGLIVLGIPWMILEFGMGHKMLKAAPGVFEGIGKKWEWAGWFPSISAFCIDTYYAVIMAWALVYVGSSVTLAWGAGEAGAAGASPYFFNTVLQLSSGPGVLGSIRWPVVAALAITWLAIFFIIFKGAELIGKVSQVVMCIAWVLIIVLVIRGVTLAGAGGGLNWYLAPDLSVLKGVDVWFAAFSQIAFTLSLGMGGMFTYGRFIAKKSDISNTALVTSLADASFAFLAGFAVFSTVGYITQALGIGISDVAISGLGLAFVTYPVGISMMPAAGSLTGVLFFLMMWMIGLSSAYFLAYAGFIVPFMDKFGWSRTKTAAGGCTICFLIGLVYCTQGGLYWLDMVDRTVCFYTLLIGGAIASIIIGWVYGAAKLRAHINETSEFKVGPWFDWLIKIVVPVGLLFVVIYGGFRTDIATPYEGYGSWANAIWILMAVVLALSFALQGIKGASSK